MLRIAVFALMIAACASRSPIPTGWSDRSPRDTPQTRQIALIQALPGAELQIIDNLGTAQATQVHNAFLRAEAGFVDDSRPGCLPTSMTLLDQEIAELAPGANRELLRTIVRRSNNIRLGCP